MATDLKKLEEAWNEAGKQAWEAEGEQERVQQLYAWVDEARKALAVLVAFYLVRCYLAERAVKSAHKANERARQALLAAQAPDEVPSAEEA